MLDLSQDPRLALQLRFDQFWRLVQRQRLGGTEFVSTAQPRASTGSAELLARGIEGGVGLGLNRFTGVSNTISALMAVGNVLTASQRAEVARKGSASPHYRGRNNDPEFQAQALARRNALVRMAAGGIAVGTGLLIREQRR